MLIKVVVAFFILLFLGVPIAYSMGIASVFAMLTEGSLSGMVMCQKVFSTLDSFSMMAIPFFMLAGALMNACNITNKLIDFANAVVGHIRGGLAQVVTLTGMLMAGISGSGNADASALGGIMLPMMEADGYDDGFSVACISAASALAPVIPPSIIMVIYSGITNMSIARLFMAGIIPGIIIGVSWMIYINFHAKSLGMKARPRKTWKEIAIATKNSLGALVMPIIIVGGILTGLFTASEAGVVACVYAVIYGLITKNLNWHKLKEALISSQRSAAIPMFVMAMAALFGYLLARENMPSIVLGALTSISTNKHILLIIIVLFITFLGMFIDGTAIIVMVVPVIIGLVPSLGYDPTHFALIVLLAVTFSGITPPVGILFYIVSSVQRTPLKRVIPKMIPFCVVGTIVIVVAIFVPQLITTVPNLLLGTI